MLLAVHTAVCRQDVLIELEVSGMIQYVLIALLWISLVCVVDHAQLSLSLSINNTHLYTLHLYTEALYAH